MTPSTLVTRRPSSLCALAAALLLGAARAVAQVPAPTAEVPLQAAEHQRLLGTYLLTSPPDTTRVPFRVFEREGALMGQLGANEPTRLAHLGSDRFRPVAVPDFELWFSPVGERATHVEARGPRGVMIGERSGASPDSSSGGPLHIELARMDSLMFDATFVRCDLAAVNAMFTDDVEFYHDQTGLQRGDEVRANNARLTANCPGKRGITRRLVPGSLRVYPLSTIGAVQTGVHRFVERGARTATEARFVHVWRRTAAGWQVARVLSFDHRPIDVQ